MIEECNVMNKMFVSITLMSIMSALEVRSFEFKSYFDEINKIYKLFYPAPQNTNKMDSL